MVVRIAAGLAALVSSASLAPVVAGPLPATAAEAPTAAARGTVAGVVTLPSGQPAAGADIGTWDPAEELYEAEAYADDDGRFAFRSVPPGDYLVYVWADYGRRPTPGVFWPDAPTEHTATVVHVGSGEEVTTDFRLSRGATITGTPRDARGRPVSGRTDVDLQLRYGACARCWTSEGDSIAAVGDDPFVASNLHAGTYRLVFTHRRYVRRVTEVTVAAGEVRRGVDVVMRRGRLVVERPGAVEGVPRVGNVLTARAPTTDPRATVTYQWLRGGSVVRGATHRRYPLRAVDRGRWVSVRFTLRLRGHRAEVRTVRAPGPIRR